LAPTLQENVIPDLIGNPPWSKCL